MGWGFRREGTYAYLWMIHADVWQKPAQYYKEIILQLKMNKLKKKLEIPQINNLTLYLKKLEKKNKLSSNLAEE